MIKIGTKIRNAREDMDLLQTDMARLIPMNQSNYSKIERNVQEPSMEQLRRMGCHFSMYSTSVRVTTSICWDSNS